MLEHAEIRALIPHRHPVLLVDRVLEMELFKRIVTTKTISGSEPCFARMREGLPQRSYAYPMSLLIESFGQSGAVLWLLSLQAKGQPTDGTLFFAAARDVTINRPVYPGDTLRHVCHVDYLKGDNAFLRGETYVGDELVASVGSAIAASRPKPSDELRTG